MIYVKVLYSDLSIRKELLEHIEKLPKDNVLFILVEDTEREGKLKNIAITSRFDNYAICQKRHNNADWIMLFGWDDDDFVWRRTVKCEGCVNREVVDMPIGNMHIVFRGKSVSDAVWKSASKKFDSEMI